MPNDNPLAPNNLGIKKEKLSAYQKLLKVADDYNISIVCTKQLVPNFFDKEKYVLR